MGGKGRWKGIVGKRVRVGAEAAIKTRKKEVEVGTRRKKVGVVAGKSTIEKEKKKRKIGRRTMTEGSAVEAGVGAVTETAIATATADVDAVTWRCAWCNY